MANLSNQEVMMIIGNKEIQIVGRDKEIELLNIKIKELETKIEELIKATIIRDLDKMEG